MKNFLLVLAVRLFACLWKNGCGEAAEVILAPNGTNGNSSNPPVAVVLIIGANICASEYSDIGRAIQDAYDGDLWFGVPDFIDCMPDPLQVTSKIGDIVLKMQEKYGLPKSFNGSAIDLFLAGHSLGGAVLDSWTYANQLSYNTSSSFENLNVIYRGQILMGSFISRKYRVENGTQVLNYDKYTISTLTISGELDGLCRVSRIIEQYYIQNDYYYQSDRNDFANQLVNWPVITVNGMSHGQFANEENSLPYFVKKFDLKPEISYAQAHNNIANIVNCFINLKIIQINDANATSSQYYKTLNEYSQQTRQLSTPFINAFFQEAFYHFQKPCYCTPQICSDVVNVCSGGAPWVEQVAQNVMGQLPYYSKVSINNTDSFHPLNQIFPVDHLPIVWNNCSTIDPNSTYCTLNTSTVTQNSYSKFDSGDTGFFSTAAIELRVKMSSRERVWDDSGYSKIANYTKLDLNGFNCAQINEMALQYGLANAPNDTLSRYEKYGVRMIIGQDIGPQNVFPVWNQVPIRFNIVYNTTNSNYQLYVRSIYSSFPNDDIIKISAGFHYCKLLSPARVMEWLYTDSLRQNFSVINSSHLFY